MHTSPGDAEKARERVGPTTPNVAGLISLHVAEYQSLTTRCTYWIMLQYALWPILVGAMSVLASAKSGAVASDQVLTWAALTIVQLIFVGFYAALGETYSNTLYMEGVLRPAASQLIGSRQFWMYESWLAKRRPLNPWWWEWLPALFCGGALFAVLVLRAPLNTTDWVAFAVNLPITILVFFLAFSVPGLRIEIASLANAA